jgi:hypothetical protein
MAEPLTITASIVSITVPALHGIQALLNDVQSITDALKTIQDLEDYLHRLSLALSSLGAMKNGEWEPLGSNLMEEVKSTVSAPPHATASEPTSSPGEATLIAANSHSATESK